MTGLFPTNTVFSFSCCIGSHPFSEILLLCDQFCVQYTCPGGAADGVMPHRHEPNTFTESAHRDRHSFPPHPVEAWLGPVGFFIEEMHGFRRLCREPLDRRFIVLERFFE